MEKFLTYSDVGSVLVGTKNFGVLLENGIGDGETLVYILDKEEKDTVVPENAEFNTVISGKVNLYKYDCSNRKRTDIKATLNGTYYVYYYFANVYFVAK